MSHKKKHISLEKKQEPTAAKIDDDHRRKLITLLRSFKTAMFATHSADLRLRARPMMLAHGGIVSPEQSNEDCVYFATSGDSLKVDEIEVDPRVVLTFQDDKHFISAAGNARLVRDRALASSLWSETWRLWFPKGQSDPNLALIRVDLDEAEYWDMGGFTGLAFLFRAARALLNRERPQSDDGANARVPL